jgi:hypothetical protein
MSSRRATTAAPLGPAQPRCAWGRRAAESHSNRAVDQVDHRGFPVSISHDRRGHRVQPESPDLIGLRLLADPPKTGDQLFDRNTPLLRRTQAESRTALTSVQKFTPECGHSAHLRHSLRCIGESSVVAQGEPNPKKRKHCGHQGSCRAVKRRLPPPLAAGQTFHERERTCAWLVGA